MQVSIGQNTQVPCDFSPCILEKDEVVFPLELGDIFCMSFVGRNASVIVSVAFHLFLLGCFSWLLIPAGIAPPQLVLEALLTKAEKPLATIEVSLEVPIEDVAETDPQVEITPEPAANLPALFPDKPRVEPVDAPPVEKNVDDPAKPSSTPPPIAWETDTAVNDGTSAEFFGTQVTGKTFVYVLDRSGSMNTAVENEDITRFDAACEELMRSIDRLTAEQSFYVVLFSTTTTRMLGDKSLHPKLLRATTANKRRLKNWLDELRPTGGTDPYESLELAIKLKPSCVFMLSDGEFNTGTIASDKIAKSIVNSQADAPIPINSIAFEDASASQQLTELSKLSGGSYRYVKSLPVSNKIEALLLASSATDLDWETRLKLANTAAIPMLESRSLLLSKPMVPGYCIN